MSATPFSFSGSLTFSVGARTTQENVAQPASSTPNVYPYSLLSPSLPSCTICLAVSCHDPIKGRILKASRKIQQGELILNESSFIHSSWDEFSCLECVNSSHPPKKCPEIKKKYNNKFIKHVKEIENSLAEIECIDELDHARNFIKLLMLYASEANSGKTTHHDKPLADFFKLSVATNLDKCRVAAQEAKELLEDVCIWPDKLSIEDAAQIIGILNTNSHELSDLGGSGMFLRASLMEHSCLPNCNFSSSFSQLNVYALRDIEEGENLCIDYINAYYLPTSCRRYLLYQSHHFHCFCTRCTAMPDYTRSFICENNQCNGIVLTAGEDDKEVMKQQWKETMGSLHENEEMSNSSSSSSSSSSSASSSASSSSPSSITPPDFDDVNRCSWRCTACGSYATAARIQTLLAAEKSAFEALSKYMDPSEVTEKFAYLKQVAKWDFTQIDKLDNENDFDDYDDEEEEEEEFTPVPTIQNILGFKLLDSTHYLFFYALYGYARILSQDSYFASKAIPVFQQLIQILSNKLPLKCHDEYVILHDLLGQVCIADNNLKLASESYHKAYEMSRAINGPSNPTTLELYDLYDNPPDNVEEMQFRYNTGFKSAMKSIMTQLEYEEKIEELQELQKLEELHLTGADSQDQEQGEEEEDLDGMNDDKKDGNNTNAKKKKKKNKNKKK